MYAPIQAANPGTEIMAMTSRRPKLPNGMTVTCPMVCALAPGVNGGPRQHTPLPMTRISVKATCQISMAFITLEVYCNLPVTWPASYLELVLPRTASTCITDLTIDNLEQGKLYATAVVPLEDVEKKGWGSRGGSIEQGKLYTTDVVPLEGVEEKGGGSTGPQGYQQPKPGAVDPELFTLTLPNPVKPGDQLKVNLSYFHPLEFEAGSYMLRVPSEIPPSAVPPGTLPQQLLDVTVAISTGSDQPVAHVSPSGHRWVVGIEKPGFKTLSLEPGPTASPNADVALGYSVWGTETSVSLNVSPPCVPTANDPDPRGSFVVSVAPPSPQSCMRANRSVVFILDRSGSMDGNPMQYAKAALIFGLGLLGAGDEFNVVAFDHEQLWFSAQLVPADAGAISAAQAWIQNTVNARGTTDIMRPLRASLAMLQAARGVPYMFLITDGCVHDEREICFMMEQVTASNSNPPSVDPNLKIVEQPASTPLIPRLSTFAIGPYCNHYFLKQLATYGRGAFDVAFRPHAIQSSMQRMLTAAERPVLSDLTISLPGVTSCELYPFPIPDLACSMPVIIAGKYEGPFPEAITINGRLPNGAAWSSLPVTASKDMGLPLDKIFIKSRLDLMTARAWLQQNPQPLVSSIVDLSVATGVPCSYTRTVGFETTPAKYQQMQQERSLKGSNKVNIAAFAIGGAAGIAIVVGVGAAIAFGDVGATMANIGSGVGDAVGEVAGCCGDGCDCCCDCDNCDCDNCDCDGLGDAAGACAIS